MVKVSTESLGRFSYHYPRLVIILTAHSQGRDNAMTVAWHAPLSFRPPLYGVAITPGRFTYQLIMESGEFGVNFVPYETAELIASVGGSRGKEVNKFERFHIARERGVKTAVPLLEDAYACYECKLVEHKPFGDHELVVGEIVVVHFAEEAFTQEGVLDIARVNPALYLGAELYVTTLKDSGKRLDRQVYGAR
jgi:flavin reductase (DIM6/NTAB) family NADH-FMN oxidoreductase RutF